ncbi:MAG: hypothetical protein LBV60_23840 [Streptomyces sp.]|jgi:hypothetical protein|nr:hypothetical protein [Streptomyces sp.]
MVTRQELLDVAASAMRRGLELDHEGADPSHPDYERVLSAEHAASAAGITLAEIYVAATQPQ